MVEVDAASSIIWVSLGYNRGFDLEIFLDISYFKTHN